MTEHDPFSPNPAPAPQALNIDLEQFDDEYEKAEAAESDDVPDGKYQVRIHAVRLNKSQAGNPMLQYELLVVSGQHTDRHIFKNSVITPNSMPFFKADLKVMGIQLPKLSELPNHLEGMLDQALEITKKTKGEYANVYFNKRLLAPPSESPANGPIPF
mgnify:CR=1 FL=1